MFHLFIITCSVSLLRVESRDPADGEIAFAVSWNCEWLYVRHERNLDYYCLNMLRTLVNSSRSVCLPLPSLYHHRRALAWINTRSRRRRVLYSIPTKNVSQISR